MKTSTFSIVFISDNNYIMPTGVAITSLKLNKCKKSIYNIYILANNVSVDNEEKILLLNEEGFSVEIKHLDNNDNYEKLYQKTKTSTASHVTSTSLYKFDICNIFESIDKVLYLDSDMIIQSDLKELFSIDLGDYYAGVVKDSGPMICYNPPITKRLNINHTAYFNSGVMLLNLKKIRKDNIREKLLEYRRYGINFFKDQDTFNVVFAENVKYLPFKYNTTISNIVRPNIKAFSDYYSMEMYENKIEYVKKAHIIHMSSSEKPWNVYAPYLTTLFKFYLDKSPFKHTVINVRFSDYYFSGFLGSYKPKIIVSLTSFPMRIQTVHHTINTLFSQTMRADHIFLWLAKSQFPNLDKDLPQELLSCCDKGLEIKWCDEDIKPHKKYYYTMQMFPDDIVITVDDDLYYDSCLIKNLYKSYLKHPHAVSAMRVNLIKLNSDGTALLPYAEWSIQYRELINIPSMKLIATGVGGILYPPYCMHPELFNIEALKKTCIYADDLWLKTMQVMNDTPVVLAKESKKIKKSSYVGNTQENALHICNVEGGKNDEQLREILKLYNTYYGEVDTLLMRINNGLDVVEEKRASDDSSLGLVSRFMKCCKVHGVSYTMRYAIKRSINLPIKALKIFLSQFLPLPYRRAVQQNNDLFSKISLLNKRLKKIEGRIAVLKKTNYQ